LITSRASAFEPAPSWIRRQPCVTYPSAAAERLGRTRCANAPDSEIQVARRTASRAAQLPAASFRARAATSWSWPRSPRSGRRVAFGPLPKGTLRRERREQRAGEQCPNTAAGGNAPRRSDGALSRAVELGKWPWPAAGSRAGSSGARVRWRPG
jgi:hypothetical protein